VSDSRPVRRVINLLEQYGYRALQTDLLVGTLSFRFAGTLVGSRNSHDLVVIVDTITDSSDSHLRRQVQALARALDMVGSRRSLTLVIVGPNPSDATLRELARACRILSVGTPTGASADDDIRDTLAVLLPLDIPEGGSGAIDPLMRLQTELTDFPGDELTRFLGAARLSSDAVEQELKDWLMWALPEDSE
jgi:hypothetical protein